MKYIRRCKTSPTIEWKLGEQINVRENDCVVERWTVTRGNSKDKEYFEAEVEEI